MLLVKFKNPEKDLVSFAQFYSWFVGGDLLSFTLLSFTEFHILLFID